MVKKIISEVKKQMLSFVTMAFSFVAALMWREAILKVLEPITTVRNGALAYTLIAVFITLIAAVMIVVLARFLGSNS